MPPNPNPQSLLSAASRQVRAQSPDLAFAGRFLSRDRRLPVYTVASVLAVLYDVMNHQEPDGDDCPSETPQQKLAVCRSILEHLYTGQSTGKPELDAFADVAIHFNVPRPDLENFAQGLASRLTTLRYATWVRLRRDRLPVASGVAAALAAVLAPEPARPLHPDAVKRLADGALALLLADDLRLLAHHWRQGRLLIPLDDLLAARLTESDLTRFQQSNTTAGDPRWRALVDRLGQRITALHDQSQSAWPALEPSCQRAAAVWSLAHRDRFTQWLAAGADPFAARSAPNEPTWRRLKRLPAVLRTLSKSLDKSARKQEH